MVETPKTPAAPDEPAMDALNRPILEYTGRTLDNRYRLLRILGRGGMGSVFLAKHVVIGKAVAVKILDVTNMRARVEESRLFREAQTAAAIGHPNIIDVLDVGVAPEGYPYLVMEYLEGEDVARILRREGAISLAAACAILEPVLLALAAAHARHIVHRDIKPANIYVAQRRDSPPNVKLIDFGVAKELGPSQGAKLTLPGSLLGTPSYMPPEQATGVEDVDTRADIYGVGVTLYEMLTNKLPFEGANYNETLFRIVTDDPARPESPIEELPESLIEIIDKAMHKDPGQRFQSASEFLEAIKGLGAWNERARAFEALASRLHVSDIATTFAEATQLSPDSPVAPRRVAAAKPVSDFVETVAEGASLEPRGGAGRAGIPWLLWASGAVSLLALVLFLLWLSGTSMTRQEAPTLAASAQLGERRAARVNISVTGAPEGAIISYDGNRVPGTPFTVDATQTVMPIRVELEGYEPFVTSVVPSHDMTLRVGMRPVQRSMPSHDAQPPEPDTTKAAGPDAGPGQKPVRHKPQPDVRESGRGTFYTDKFE